MHGVILFLLEGNGLGGRANYLVGSATRGGVSEESGAVDAEQFRRSF